VPYFDRKYLYEAAVLNGGNALALFVKNLHKFVAEFDPTSTEGMYMTDVNYIHIFPYVDNRDLVQIYCGPNSLKKQLLLKPTWVSVRPF
jgi:hypothetical protein